MGTIPAGVIGLTLQDTLRKGFAKPTEAAIFLARQRRPALQRPRCSGGVRRRSRRTTMRASHARWDGGARSASARLSRSRSSPASRVRARRWGAGSSFGLSNKDAARFAFLLATPIIGAAALLKLPELLGSQGDGVRGQALVGALGAAVTAYLAVRFLMRFFETNTLIPFAVYCLLAGIGCTIYFVS